MQFRNPTITPSWRKVSKGEEEREKMPLIEDTQFSDSACNPLGPTCEMENKLYFSLVGGTCMKVDLKIHVQAYIDRVDLHS